MAGHIDVRVGQWAQAQEQNRQAIKIDEVYRKVSPRQGFYNIYMAHNHQFLSWACMHGGRKEECLAAARRMMEGIPKEFIEGSPAAIDGYLHLEIEAQLRFGEWDKVLAQKEPPATLPIKRSFWRYGRATALASKGDIAGAEREQAEFRKAVEAVPPDAKMAINNARKVLQIAEHALAGEIAYQRGNIDDAVKQLTMAVEIEDQLKYIEPPDWVWPVRHTLGAVLSSAGRFEEAEQVYRADLKKWPENGWSLYGLLACLKARNAPEAAAVEARFKKVWSGADIQIASTCLCIPGKKAAGGE
jgi:tetratricopeptide (TPR) repeat protein